ncbi:hemerythrin domain-containing protein [Thioflexithrix psekupsensis]|uniref:Hemerythrin-like domain-containing protein n=1 Tax=Thioflexithrix psekupsensis TaxID=1570016 RepID=A0A251X4J0_9GAMM|nr:hemerythrin domain-containing protein [Thioflexithrix psekupsensis]OUD12008.1 hypothetical protein TPSD3_12775 [Thioflexithrix psekupsensis]
MSAIINKLHQEHIGIAKLLDLLDTQMATFHAGDTPDYQIMSDIMHYMVHYPDMYHHPSEDVLFSHLKQRDPSLQGEIEELLQQHELLIEKGRAFFNTLQLAMDDTAMFSRATLETQANEYIALLRGHIDKEEGKVMPRAAQTFSEADWQQVHQGIKELDDPLFGSTVKEDYAALYHYLTAQ